MVAVAAVLTVAVFGVFPVRAQTQEPAPAPPKSSLSGAHESFAIARELAAAGDVQRATEAWRRGLESFGDEPYARLEYASFLTRQGQLPEAAEQFRVALDLDPGNPDLLWAAGVFLRRHPDATEGALDESERLLLRLVEVRPDDPRAWLELGILAISRRDYDGAAESFGRARALAPSNLAATGYLAEALVRAGRLGEGEQVLVELLRKDPSQLRARMALTRIHVDSGDLKSAIEVLRSVPADQASDPAVRRRLAFLLADVSEIDEAAELTSSLLADAPGDLELRKLAVRLEAVAGRYEDAAELLRVYVRASPEDVDAVVELAEYLEMLGLEDEAVSTLERGRAALKDGSDGERRLTLYLLDLLGRRGEWEAVLAETQPQIDSQHSSESPDWTVFPLHAEALYHARGLRPARKFLASLASGSPAMAPAARAKEAELLLADDRERQARQVLTDLAATDGALGPSLAARVWSIRDRPDEALVPAHEALRRAPESVELRFQLASILDDAGQWSRAERELLAIVEAQPDHAPALNYLGYAWADRQADPVVLERALELTRRAVELSPGNGAYQDSLGWAYFKLGRYEDARPHLERAAALIVNDPVILEHLGDLYRAIGDHGRARTFYRWAVRMDSDNQDLSGKLGQLSEDG